VGRTPAVSELHVESNLPAGWIPEHAYVHMYGHRRNEDDMWEVLIPEYTVAGQGDSIDAAVRNALELLDDYLVLCVHDGMSFEESRRPISSALRRAMIRDIAGATLALLPGAARALVSRGRPPERTSEHYKLPLRLLVC
jgi:hypothetical protein